MSKKIEKDEAHFEKHMHDGHRGRLLATVNETGLFYLSQVQILEFILFYIFPRGDVNPIAHRLLAKFNCISAVMEAPFEALVKVKGMGEASAKKLQSLLSIFDIYNIDKINSSASVANFVIFLDNIEMLLRNKNEECCYIFAVMPNGNINYGRLFSKGDAGKVDFEVTEISSYISTYKVKSLIFVHNHPGGSCFPSLHDMETNERLKHFLKFCGVHLYDSIIIGKNGIFSCETNSIRREFGRKPCKLDNLTDYQKVMLQTTEEE